MTRSVLLKSFGAHSFGNAITLIDRLLLVPVLFSTLPATTANAWLVVRTVPSYLAAGDVGLSSEAGNRMTHALHEGEPDRARALYSTCLFVISCLGLLLGAAFFTWTYLAGAPWLAARAEVSWGVAFMALMFTTLYALQINQSQLVNAVFRSVARDHVGVTLTHCVRACEMTLFVAAITLTAHIGAGAAAYCGARAVGNVLLHRAKRRSAPWAVASRSLVDMRLLKRMVRPALGFAALPFSMGLQQQAPLLVLADAQGLGLAGAYATAQTFARLIAQYGLQITRTVWPALTRAASEQPGSDDFWRLHDRAVGLAAVGGIALGALAVAMAPHLLAWWTVGQVRHSLPTVALLVAAAVVNAVWHVSYSSELSTSRHGRIAGLHALVMLSSLPLLWWLVQPAGADRASAWAAGIGLAAELLLLVAVARRVGAARGIGMPALVACIARATWRLLPPRQGRS